MSVTLVFVTQSTIYCVCRARACPTLAAVVTDCRCHATPLYVVSSCNTRLDLFYSSSDAQARSGSARDVSYNPEQHARMKHVLRRHFFVRDMVEEFEITVPFVRTADNWADFFTKPMKNAKEFKRMRAEIMNEPRDPLG